jgi:hypothetical protein
MGKREAHSFATGMLLAFILWGTILLVFAFFLNAMTMPFDLGGVQKYDCPMLYDGNETVTMVGGCSLFGHWCAILSGSSQPKPIEYSGNIYVVKDSRGTYREVLTGFCEKKG